MAIGGRPQGPQMEPSQRLLEKLQEEWTEQQAILQRWLEDGVMTTLKRPTILAVGAITLMPELFQPREGISEKHVADLAKAIKSFGELDPVTVMIVGERTILIDGHHRIEAYGRAKWNREIPVRHFEGSPSEAVLAATEANSVVKLPMDGRERQNRAWRLVLMRRYSKPQIARAAGVSERQIANMRTVMRQLGDAAFSRSRSWFLARMAATGVRQMNEDQASLWSEELAQRYADGMAKLFSTKMADNPRVAAMALEKYFGRRLPEVWQELKDFVDVDRIERHEAEQEAWAEVDVAKVEAFLAEQVAAKVDRSSEAEREDDF